ncbi:Testis-specific Y-encoded protein 3 [Myotis davidii]|uniref:Testis-specific Y-encoded protein 3 n=1 Tax=Myotis davidii TaxID=225400 RepID=L5MHU2_MYODS|nr:Testis-specific Y-encoded protein 3 [Myotis davidii]
MISIQDENMLGHMIELKVREVRHPWGYCTISLYFRSNPYFRNHVIVKEYLITLTGCPVQLSLSGPSIVNEKPPATVIRQQNQLLLLVL